MKILIMSVCGEGAMLVQNLRTEGHDVIMHIAEPQYGKILDGIIWKTEDPLDAYSQADVIVFDDNGLGKKADSLREYGYKVWNGGTWVERLEYDRLYGMKIFQDCGIPTPETYEVNSVKDVNTIMRSEFSAKEKAVIKISGEDGAGTSFSFVASSREELLEQVSHWDEDKLLPNKWSGILQRFVDGIEISVEGWWNGEQFSMHNLTIEEKKPWPGDLGPSVGCAGNIVARISSSSKLVKTSLDPLIPILKKKGYIGQIDVNSIVNDEGIPLALEFTPRAGYDATPTLVWGCGIGYGNAIGEALGMAGLPPPLPRRGRFAAGVRVTIPPYPFESSNQDLCHEVEATAEGCPLDLPEAIHESFYVYDVINVDGKLKMAGTTGIVGIAMGAGETVKEAGNNAYKVAEKVKVPNKAYRALDLFDRAAKDIPELESVGLIKIE